MRVLPDKAQDHLARHLRRLARDPHRANYDLVIVDPPAFGVGRGNERVLRLLWPELFASLRAMKPRTLVLLSNDKAFRVASELRRAGRGRSSANVIVSSASAPT